jgi:hypothetical protein
MPWYAAVVHPAKTKAVLSKLSGHNAVPDAAWARVTATLRGAPITVEHEGVYAALNQTRSADGQLASREDIIEALYENSEDGATFQIVGHVCDASQCGEGIYIIFQIDTHMAEWIEPMIRMGHYCGVSLTHEEWSGNAIEVALTNNPAREHCYMIAEYSTREKAQAYLRGIQSGIMADYSGTLQKPRRIMAASGDAMTGMNPPASDMQRLVSAIQLHPDEVARTGITTQFQRMIKKNAADISTLRQENTALQAEKERLEHNAAVTRKATETGKKHLMSMGTRYSKRLPPDIAESFDIELMQDAVASNNPDLLMTALGQVITCASASTVANSVPRFKNSRKVDAEEEEAQPAKRANVEDVAPEPAQKVMTEEEEFEAACNAFGPA